MSDIKNIFDIAARGMSSQMVRLNTVASNLANSRTVASSDAEAYKAIKAVFKTVYADDVQRTGVSSVDVDEIVEVDRPRVRCLTLKIYLILRPEGCHRKWCD